MNDPQPPAGAPAPKPLAFTVSGGTITVLKDPKFDDKEFQRQCDLLLQTPHNPVVIDLAKVGYLQSPEIAFLFVFVKKAKQMGKTVELRVSRTVQLVLKRIQLDHLAGVHTPEEGAGQD